MLIKAYLKALVLQKDGSMPTQIPFDSLVLQNILEHQRELPGAMLPILHEVQEAFGYVPEEAVPSIAKALNVSRAEVHGVVTFYHHFRDKPAGHTVVQICRAEACQSLGADDLCLHAQTSLDCAFHETRADGMVSLEPVFCLGQCAVGPAIVVGDALHARVTARRFDEIMGAIFGKPL